MMEILLRGNLPVGDAWGFALIWILRWLLAIIFWIGVQSFLVKKIDWGKGSWIDLGIGALNTLIIVCPIYWIRQTGTGPGIVSPIYDDIHLHGIPYLIVSAFLLFVGFEIYFYLTHRLLHTRFLYDKVHSIHHLSPPLRSSMVLRVHPVEALLIYSWPFPLLMFMPLQHDLVNIFVWFVVFQVTAVHTELPDSWQSFLPRFMVTPNIHRQHHLDQSGNFGLFFRFSDEIFGSTTKKNL